MPFPRAIRAKNKKQKKKKKQKTHADIAYRAAARTISVFIET